MNASTTIHPVGGFMITSLAVTPEGVIVSYDAPGVGGVFAITNQQFESTGRSINIENSLNRTTRIDGEQLPPGIYRIADIGGLPEHVYDLGSFQIPGNMSMTAPIQPFCEIEIIDTTLRIPGPGKWFIATKRDESRIILPIIRSESQEIVVQNWASMSGFGPNDAKPIMIWVTEQNGDEHPMFPLQPGETRTFIGIRTSYQGLRWAIL